MTPTLYFILVIMFARNYLCFMSYEMIPVIYLSISYLLKCYVREQNIIQSDML